MKKIIVFLIGFVCLLLYSFYTFNDFNNKEEIQSRDIVLSFITYNAYGNNLYIDNVLTGQQPANDIMVTSILNIPYDTTYSTLSSGTDTISPIVTVTNIGRNSADSIKVYIQISTGYFDSTTIPLLLSGQTVSETFSQFEYTIGAGFFIKSYTAYSLDSNRVNDTLYQYTLILPGYERNVLFEEFTSNSSPACANNNYALDTFVNSNIQTTAAIKYHCGILPPDSFYLANTQQVNARQRYYFVSSVPVTIIDGRQRAVIPYGTPGNLSNPYNTQLSKGTPFSIIVTDEIINGNSIKTTIDVNIISVVAPGNYRLRINAIERYKYATEQGTNGEVNFYDIFRQAYPDTNGISIPTNTGSYQYTYTYYLEPAWTDSLIYTSVFIQNDNNREVFNCAKGRNNVLKIKKNPFVKNSGRADVEDFGNQSKSSRKHLIGSDSIQTSLNVELFESYFPPLGWEVFNEDGFITFSQFNGANGPTYGGSKSVIMNFFNYNIPGQKDSMFTKIYRGLLSTDTVRFDYAYAQYNAVINDSLIVKISTDGGLTFPTEIFRKGGQSLATAPPTTTPFIPSNSTQWKTFKHSLNGIVSINNSVENVSENFKLMQNYPNPFNPFTIINYELRILNNVTIKVYDIIGKEVGVLFDGRQNAGKYSVEFDGTNYSSGIYFYTLFIDGKKLDTKKMLLLK